MNKVRKITAYGSYFNGFQKKSQKTPSKEIDKALRIKEAYYDDKQNNRL